MSEQKPQTVAVSANEGMVMRGHKYSGKNKVRAKLLGAGIAALAILCALAVGGVFIFKKLHTNSAQQPPTQSQNGAPTGFSSFTFEQKAEYYNGQKNYQAAINVYDAQLKSAKSASGKADIYRGLGTVELDAQDYAKAEQYAQQAYDADPNAETARFLADTAKMSGDKKAAAKYYQVAIDLINKETGLSDANRGYILKGLQQDLQGVSQ